MTLFFYLEFRGVEGGLFSWKEAMHTQKNIWPFRHSSPQYKVFSRQLMWHFNFRGCVHDLTLECTVYWQINATFESWKSAWRISSMRPIQQKEGGTLGTWTQRKLFRPRSVRFLLRLAEFPFSFSFFFVKGECGIKRHIWFEWAVPLGRPYRRPVSWPAAVRAQLC